MNDRQGTVSVGVVGAGRVASHRHMPVLEVLDGVEPGFVADIDGDSATRLGDVYGYTPVVLDDKPDPEALPDCDAALLALPLGAREPYVREFATRATPVLSEKPFAPDLETHRRLVDGHETIACNYMRTAFSSVHQARDFLRSCPFGALQRVELLESGKVGSLGLAPDHYQTDPDHRGAGILLERGCHSLSQLVALFPDDELSVEDATVRRTEGVDVDVTASLRALESDVPISVRFSAVERVDSALALEFEAATVALSPETGDDLRVSVHDAAHEFVVAPDDRWATTTDEAMYCRWEQFLRAVRGEQDLDVPTATGRAVSRLIGDLRTRGRDPGGAGA